MLWQEKVLVSLIQGIDFVIEASYSVIFLRYDRCESTISKREHDNTNNHYKATKHSLGVICSRDVSITDSSNGGDAPVETNVVDRAIYNFWLIFLIEKARKPSSCVIISVGCNRCQYNPSTSCDV